MIQSQQVLEWMAEGEVRGQARTLLRVLRARFGNVPAELETAIQATTDLDQLDRWADTAATAPTLEAFRQAASL